MDVKLDGQSVSCLLASGTTSTFVNYVIFNRLFPYRYFKRAPDGETATAANGTTMIVRGSIMSTFDFGQSKLTLKITLIEDLDYDAILGLEFLDEYVTAIYTQDKRIQLTDGCIVQFTKVEVKKLPVTSLVVNESVTILPHSVTTVQCSITQRQTSSHVMCIKDSSTCAQRYGVLLPYCAFGLECSRPSIRVVNPTGESGKSFDFCCIFID